MNHWEGLRFTIDSSFAVLDENNKIVEILTLEEIFEKYHIRPIVHPDDKREPQ